MAEWAVGRLLLAATREEAQDEADPENGDPHPDEPSEPGSHPGKGEGCAGAEEAQLPVDVRVVLAGAASRRPEHADQPPSLRARKRSTPSLHSRVRRATALTSAPRATASSNEAPSMP